MKKELEVFENRSDDWLAKEVARERATSVWDFDDGQKLKNEHYDNCEAREIKENHARIHSAYRNEKTNVPNRTQLNNAKKLALLPIVISGLFVFGIFAQVGILSEDSVFFVIPYIVFMFIIISTVTSIRRKK